MSQLKVQFNKFIRFKYKTYRFQSTRPRQLHWMFKPFLFQQSVVGFRRTFSFLLFGKSNCNEIASNVKDVIASLSRLLSRQCEVHFSQKLKQSLQFYCYYSRIWGDEMSRKMISGVSRLLVCHGRKFLLSAVCLIPFDWKKNMIPDSQLESAAQEFHSVGDLCSATVLCPHCHKRQVIDKIVPGTEYCMCNGGIVYTNSSHRYECWEPFLERENILVWRRKIDPHSSLYSYKVYGNYSDMSVSAFMEVQLNTDHRPKWDATALELTVVDSFREANSDLIYWKVKFPKFFADRDYVFKRRYKVDENKKEVVIVNELTEDDRIPEVRGIHRVKEYWSIMVLKSNNSFYEPGMSYTLTYFDNPGTSLPSPVTSFVATTAFPDYLNRVYKAALNLQHRWESGEYVYVSLPHKLRYPARIEVPIAVEPEVDTTLEIAEAVTKAFGKDSGQKMALQYKRAVVDLLEAIEVVSPDFDEKTFFATGLEKFLNLEGMDKEKKMKLIHKLEKIRLKTKGFIQNSAKKKEESLKIMNEFETRKSHYNHEQLDERTVLLIRGFFDALNEILKENKNMKTGKGLAQTGTSFPGSLILKALQTKKFHREKGEDNTRNCPHECSFPGRHCLCCACGDLIESDLSSDSYCNICVCEHKALFANNFPKISAEMEIVDEVCDMNLRNVQQNFDVQIVPKWWYSTSINGTYTFLFWVMDCFLMACINQTSA